MSLKETSQTGQLWAYKLIAELVHLHEETSSYRELSYQLKNVNKITS